MTDNLNSLLGIANRASSVKLRNVLTPILWLCALCLPIGLFGLSFAPTSLAWVFIVLLLAPVSAAIASFVWFALKDPRLLQSEEYLLREEQLRLMSKKGEVTDPAELKAVDLDSPLLFKDGGENE